MNRKLIVKLEAPELMAAILALAEAFQQNRPGTVLPEAVVQEIEEKKEAVKPIALSELTARLGTLIKAGKKDQVTALVKKYGADKLSEVPEDKYIKLFNEAGAIQLN